MRKFRLLLALFFLSLCITVHSQEQERFSFSVSAGKGNLFGKSNLSVMGCEYRSAYDKGFDANMKVAYLVNRIFQIGVKYDFFQSAGDFTLSNGSMVVSDAELNYIAPQVGIRKNITNKLLCEFMVGAGYVHYKNSGEYGGNEYKATKGFCASNFDASFFYRIYNHVYLGIGASFMGGNASSFDMDGAGTVDLEGRDKLKLRKGDVFVTVRCQL